MKTSQKYSGRIITLFINKILIVVFGFLVFGNVYSQNSNCNAKLDVINNQFGKKAGVSGVSYRLMLTNTGFDSSVYEIKLVSDNVSKNKQLISKNNLINIKGEFYNVSLKKMKSISSSSIYNKKGNSNENEVEIFLNGKESKTFIVKIKTPIGAKIGSKIKSKVQVTSGKCKNSVISVVLNTEIIDGE